MDLASPHLDLTILETFQTQGLAQPWQYEGKDSYKLTPASAEDTAKLLHWASESNLKIALYETVANLLPTPLWLDLSHMKKVRKYSPADFVIQVECGMTIRELEAELAPNQQAFPLSYPPNATLGEILAEERPSLETGLKGLPRDYVLKTEIATPDGQVTISGADVVKNVTGYDLAKLYVGGWHTLGVMTSVTLKLGALPPTRSQWHFTFTSLNSAVLFAKQILAQHGLPMRVFELYRTDDHWHALIELAGDAPVVEKAQQALKAFPLEHLTDIPAEPLDTRSGREALHKLQNWPENHTVLEVALPLSNWPALVAQIARQGSLGTIRFQIRPAAGLVYMTAPLFPFAALRHIQKEAMEHEGQFQILSISAQDAANASDTLALFEEFNLPQNPVLRNLMNTLKKSYDPNGVLFTPRLPL